MLYNKRKKHFTLETITALVWPLAKKYHLKDIYLFGSYARGEADAQKVDIFEIREVNPDSDFYQTIMKEKVLVAWCKSNKHTISLRVTDDEKHLIQSYAASHHLSVSSFIRDLVLDQLEEDGELEEARILKALELSYKEVYDLEEML